MGSIPFIPNLISDTIIKSIPKNNNLFPILSHLHIRNPYIGITIVIRFFGFTTYMIYRLLEFTFQLLEIDPRLASPKEGSYHVETIVRTDCYKRREYPLPDPQLKARKQKEKIAKRSRQEWRRYVYPKLMIYIYCS